MILPNSVDNPDLVKHMAESCNQDIPWEKVDEASEKTLFYGAK